MKKFFTQILTAIGFVIALVGVIMGYKSENIALAFASLYFIAAALATTFVFAKNESVKNMGYVLSAVAGAYGITRLLIEMDAKKASVPMLIFAIGLIVMLVPALIYAIIQFFSWCGFTRKGNKADASDIATVLNQYKMLEKEKILSADEFESLKEKVLKNSGSAVSSVDDLKKWKKLLDQQIITDEEFSNLKAQVFQK